MHLFSVFCRSVYHALADRACFMRVCVCVCVDMTCVREFDLRGFTQCQGCRSGFFLLDGWVRVRFEFGLVFGLSG